MKLRKNYRAVAAAKDPNAKAYYEDPRHRPVVTVDELDNARLERRMRWVNKTLTERANAAANGVVFSDPEIDPENPPKTLEEWIQMSQPTGEVIEGYEDEPTVQTRVLAAE